MTESKKKVLIVGENSYLATGLTFDNDNYFVDSIKRPFETNLERNYKNYDYIINFCIQPEHFTRKLDESELIDVSIARMIKGTNTRLVFLSSRKVYGSCLELKEYRETDELKPYDFYSENKVAIEKKLQKLIPENLLILRTGNIIGETTRKNKNTFIGWLEKELEEKGKVHCTILPETKKDFITKDYFQKVMFSAIKNNLNGIFNIGMGNALSIRDILSHMLPSNLIDFSLAVNKSEQFILNTDKINKYTEPLTIEELVKSMEQIKSNLLLKYMEHDK